MKQKRILLIAFIFAILAIVWVAVLQQLFKVDQIKEQKELVSEADSYAEKQLFVRSVELYTNALQINTTDKRKTSIESKLLDAYFNLNDDENYETLVGERIANGSATDEEIANAIKMYASSYLFTDALDTVEAGLKIYPESKLLLDEYDEIRFMYRTNNLMATDIKFDDNTGKIAAQEDGKWYYINNTGNLIFKVSFDEATPFYKDSDGGQFAVVKSEGKYYVINKDGALYGRDDTGVDEGGGIAANHVIAKKDGKYGFYNYDFESSSEKHRYDLITMNSNGLVAIQNGDKWGIITDGGETIIPIELDEVAVNSLNQAYRGGNAMVKRGKSWEMVDLKGKKVGEESFANAKAPESKELIAVSNEKSLWGFIDRTGKLVIDYQYKDADSFSDGVAAVKTSNGWGYISENNKMVIEDDFSEAFPFHNGCAVVKNDDQISTITFENYR